MYKESDPWSWQAQYALYAFRMNHKQQKKAATTESGWSELTTAVKKQGPGVRGTLAKDDDTSRLEGRKVADPNQEWVVLPMLTGKHDHFIRPLKPIQPFRPWNHFEFKTLKPLEFDTVSKPFKFPTLKEDIKGNSPLPPSPALTSPTPTSPELTLRRTERSLETETAYACAALIIVAVVFVLIGVTKAVSSTVYTNSAPLDPSNNRGSDHTGSRLGEPRCVPRGPATIVFKLRQQTLARFTQSRPRPSAALLR